MESNANTAFWYWLQTKGVCNDGLQFAIARTVQQVWVQCERNPWLWWFWWRTDPPEDEIKRVFSQALRSLGLWSPNVQNCIDRWTDPLWTQEASRELLDCWEPQSRDTALTLAYRSRPLTTFNMYIIFGWLDIRKFVTLETVLERMSL